MRANELKQMNEEANKILGMEKSVASHEEAKESAPSSGVASKQFDPLGMANKPGFDDNVKVGGIFDSSKVPDVEKEESKSPVKDPKDDRKARAMALKAQREAMLAKKKERMEEGLR